MRTTFTAAVAAATVFALVSPASADPVTGRYDGHQRGTESKVNLTKPNGDNVRYTAALMRLNVGGKTLLTYCIEASTSIDKQSRYSESNWANTRLGKRAKYVNWILHHSVPFITSQQLARDAGLSAAPTRQEAVAGTQAAIWRYSDGYRLRANDNPAKVVKIYNYLTSGKNTGMGNEPAPTLSLSPETVTGEPGKLLGPITVATSAKRVRVAPAGVPEGAKLLGPDKKTEVTRAANGDKLYLSVPEGTPSGRAKVTADVVAKVSPGRVFKGDRKTQTLILASSENVAVHDEAVVAWTHTPTAAPGSESEMVCKPKAGVKVVLKNAGDANADFTVTYGKNTEKVTVKGGEAKWKVLPIKEDAAYKITVKSGDYVKTYKGVLNCLEDSPKPPSGGAGDLPETGLNSLTTILGTGAGLLIAGLAVLFVLRLRGRREQA